MPIKVSISIAVCFFVLGSGAHARSEAPNIVIILADDMGIDSVAALNEKCGVGTPNLDRLVAQGLTFTDAHSGSAVCSSQHRRRVLAGAAVAQCRRQSLTRPTSLRANIPDYNGVWFGVSQPLC